MDDSLRRTMLKVGTIDATDIARLLRASTVEEVAGMVTRGGVS